MPITDKKWYTSKTLIFNLLVGASMMLAVFMPDLGAVAFVNTHFDPAGVGLGWSIINIILRLVTKTEIS